MESDSTNFDKMYYPPDQNIQQMPPYPPANQPPYQPDNQPPYPPANQSYPSTQQPPPYPVTDSVQSYPPTVPTQIQPYPQANNAPTYPPQNQAPYPPPSQVSPVYQQNQPPVYPGSTSQQQEMQNYGYTANPVTAYNSNPGSISTPRTSSGNNGAAFHEDNWSADREMGDFTEKAVRLGFIKKVFGLLTIMLLLTAGVMCLFMFVPGIHEYAKNHSWLYICSVFLYLGVVIVLVCVGETKRKFPQNIICLFIISLLMGVMLGCIATSFDTDEVLIALGITILITIGMMLLGFQNKIDFTWLSGVMGVALLCLIGFGFMCAIIQSNILNMFYASLGAFIFSLLIVVDVQLIVGGKHKHAISPEEYILATLNLYLDIINLLLFILMIIAGSK